MVHRGLGESTIVQYIGDNGVKQHLNVSDLLRLHEEGVSERIIHAMQTAKVFEAEANAKPVLPETSGHSAGSIPQPFKPSRKSVSVEQFGPSILTPPQDSADEN